MASVRCCDGYRPGGRAGCVGLRRSQPVRCARAASERSAAQGVKSIVCKPPWIAETTGGQFWGCGINEHVSFEGEGRSCQPGSRPSFLHFCCAKFVLKWEETALKIKGKTKHRCM